MVVTGVGSDPDKAIQNALAEAVRQTLGALVDAEGVVKDDEARDDILTQSRGYVQSYQVVKLWQKDGLHDAQIRAAVAPITARPFDLRSVAREAVGKWATERGFGDYRLRRFDDGTGLGRALRRAFAAGGFSSLYIFGEGGRRVLVRVWADPSSRTIFFTPT